MVASSKLLLILSSLIKKYDQQQRVGLKDNSVILFVDKQTGVLFGAETLEYK